MAAFAFLFPHAIPLATVGHRGLARRLRHMHTHPDSGSPRGKIIASPLSSDNIRMSPRCFWPLSWSCPLGGDDADSPGTLGRQT